RPHGAHALRGEPGDVRAALPVLPRARRAPRGARRAPPRVAAPEVPVRWGAIWFLLGTGLALGVGVLLVYVSVLAGRAAARFGDPDRVRALATFDPAKRRAWKGVLLVLAVALAFVAAAQPKYGTGTQLVPARNVDVVIVLDYSKSMYARDVEPSR